RDVTEQVTADRRARVYEEKLRAIVEQTETGFVVLDRIDSLDREIGSLVDEREDLEDPEDQEDFLGAPLLIPARTWDEFNGRFGLTQQTWEQLQPHVVMLPTQTTVNVNTASAEVIYAAIDELSFGGAQSVVRYRERVTFNSLNDLRATVSDNITLNGDLIGVASMYFVVDGQAQVRDAVIRAQALLERSDGRVYVLWRQD
ncbi:MAG: type II secretion system protein GspK, partial [Limnobacter sp.]|nr:type II secretion system protein GspK [Limnobacter sp.]